MAETWFNGITTDSILCVFLESLPLAVNIYKALTIPICVLAKKKTKCRIRNYLHIKRIILVISPSKRQTTYDDDDVVISPEIVYPLTIATKACKPI